MSAIAEAPPSESPAVTPGPKSFTPSAAEAAPSKSRREVIESYATPLPTPPKDFTKPPTTKPEAKKEEPPKPPETKQPESKKEAPKATETPKQENPPPQPEKAKVNPWKERDKERARADAAEARIREFESNRLKEEDRTVLESTRKRNEELENEIRFSNWKKSKDYDKFYKPYADKWDDTVNYLSQLPVTDRASGEQRRGSPEDLMELFSLDPVKRAERALELTGGNVLLANELSGEVKKLQELQGNLTKAEKEALEQGETREQQVKVQEERKKQVLREHTEKWAKTALDEWNKDPDSALFDEIKPREDGKEFTPEEKEHNAIVLRGKELAKVLEKRVEDCKTVEEAQSLVRKQAAVVKRAVHFGPLRHIFTKQRKELASVKAELAKFQETTPQTSAGRQTNGHGAQSNDPRSGRRERLMKYAGLVR